MQKLPFSHFRLIETWILQCVLQASILHLPIVSTKHPFPLLSPMQGLLVSVYPSIDASTISKNLGGQEVDRMAGMQLKCQELWIVEYCMMSEMVLTEKAT